MIILAWGADFALFLLVLTLAAGVAILVTCLAAWGVAAAWRRIARMVRDRQFAAYVSAELKRDPEPPAGIEEGAAFAAYLTGRGDQ